MWGWAGFRLSQTLMDIQRN